MFNLKRSSDGSSNKSEFEDDGGYNVNIRPVLPIHFGIWDLIQSYTEVDCFV